MGGLASGCDRGTPTLEPLEVGPPVHVQTTVPAEGARDVPLDSSIRIQFDRFLSRSAVLRQSATICTGSADAVEAGAALCVPFPEPEYDPVDRVAVWKPDLFLIPNAYYTVRIHAPTDEADPFGVRAFDGAPLDRELTLSFFTAEASPRPCASDADCAPLARCSSRVNGHCTTEPRREIDYCYAPEPSPAFAPATEGPAARLSACGGGTGYCHGPSSKASRVAAGTVPLPMGGALVLADGGVRDYVGKVAVETAVGPDPRRAARANAPFGVNMPYVDPGNPANSYLLWKLVLKMSPDQGPIVKADEERPGPVEPWIPMGELQPIAEREYARLARRIRGSGMPYLEPISVASIRTIEAWIAEGAPTPECQSR